jgi:hypothetical protein
VAEHNSPTKVTLFSLRLRARALLLRSQVKKKKIIAQAQHSHLLLSRALSPPSLFSPVLHPSLIRIPPRLFQVHLKPTTTWAWISNWRTRTMRFVFSVLALTYSLL